MLRLPTFQRLVIDWDESVYVLIGDQWLDGHLPYTTVWDHKPIGAYLIVRIAMTLLGRTVLAQRVATTLFVFVAALLIRRIAARLLSNELAGLFAAIAYPAFTLLLGGTASNAEHYFIALSLAGGLLLLRCHQEGVQGRSRVLHVLAAGLMFGLALQVKYLVLPEVALFGALFLVLQRKLLPRASIACLALLGLSAVLLPTTGAAAYFAAAGEWSTFVDANFVANARHAHGLSAAHLFGSVIDWFRATGVLWLLFGLSWFAPSVLPTERLRHRPLLLLLGAWLGATLLEAFATGKFYGHYYLPTIAPACVVLALTADWLKLTAGRKSIAVVCAGLVGLVPLAEAVKTIYWPWAKERASYGSDPQLRIASALRAHLEANEGIFVLSGEPILYLLVHSPLPTKFVFPPFLLDPHFSSVANVDYLAEFRRIARSAPRCVVVRRDGSPRIDEFKAMLGPGYVTEPVTLDTDILCRGPVGAGAQAP